MELKTVKDILHSFGLEELTDSFAANDVDLEVFNLLHKHLELLKEVIPSVGKRIKFIEKYNEYIVGIDGCSEIPQKSSRSASTVSVNSDVDDLEDLDISFTLPPPSKKPCLNEVSLEIPSTVVMDSFHIDEQGFLIQGGSIFPKGLEFFLNENREGKLLLLSKTEVLSDIKKKKLTRIIVDYLLTKYSDIKISQLIFQQVSVEICSLFQKESPEIYFRPYKSSEQKSSGKLWSRYINVKKSYKRLKKHTAAVKESASTHTPIDEQGEYALEFCKYNVTPIAEVQVNWNLCYEQRKKLLKNGIPISEYFQAFPILKQPSQGYVLLLNDFNRSYPDRCDKLYNNWSRFREAIRAIELEEGIKFEFDEADIDALFNFPLIFPSTTVREKRSYRPSRLEVLKAFMVYVRNAADIHAEIQKRREYSQEQNITLQPFMLFSGDRETGFYFYCIVNDVLYQTETLVKTLDVTFKIIYALDLKYQVQCRHVWLCIQKLLFGIENINDKSSISTDIVISKIINKLNSL